MGQRDCQWGRGACNSLHPAWLASEMQHARTLHCSYLIKLDDDAVEDFDGLAGVSGCLGWV